MNNLPREDQTWQAILDDKRLLAGMAVTYSLLLAPMLGKLSLWLDEVLQLEAIHGQNAAGILQRVSGNAGSAPLGYFVQAAFVDVFGQSAVWARLPSALFSVLGCLSVVWLARGLRLRWAAVSVLAFILLPIQFRYALEGRPYSLALFLSILTTALAVRLAGDPSLLWTVLYGLAVTLNLYTLPYALFVPLAHLAWAVWGLHGLKRRRTLIRLSSATFVAGGLFLPWLLYVRSNLRAAIASNMAHFEFTWRTPLMLLREAVGGSYWVSVPLLMAAGFGLASRRVTRSTKVLLLAIVVISVLGPLAVDAYFDYFLAARQMIFILPALVLLAVEGVKALYEWRKAAGAALLSVIVVAAYTYDTKWFSRPRENYQLAAAALRSTSANDACIMYIPAGVARVYAFFEPSLSSRTCEPRQAFTGNERVVLAIAPVAPTSEIKPVFARMRGDSMIPLRRTAVGGTSITLYQALPLRTNP